MGHKTALKTITVGPSTYISGYRDRGWSVKGGNENSLSSFRLKENIFLRWRGRCPEMLKKDFTCM